MKIGLIGNGRIARRHVEAIAEVPNLDLVGIVEIQQDRRKQLDKRFKGPFYKTVEEMMENHPDIDLISILVESGNHFKVAIDVLKFSVPVVVEKPLALSLYDADAMVRKYAMQQVPLFVVKQNRLNPAVRESLQAVHRKEIGKVLTVIASVLWSRNTEYYLSDPWRLDRALDGGVVWNQASHYVDLLVAVLGEIDSVFAFGENFLSPAQTEDTVFAVLRASSGALGSLHATTTIRPTNFEGSITVSGESGLIRIGGHALNEISHSTVGSVSAKPLETLPSSEKSEVYGLSHTAFYLDILDDLSGGLESQFRAAKGLHVVAVMEAIERSVLQRREVSIAEIWKDALNRGNA